MAYLAEFTTSLALRSRTSLSLAALGVALLASALPHGAGATVVFDDYRGRVNLASGTTPTAPNYYNNNNGNVPLNNLINFAAGGAGNIASSGTLDTIDWGRSAPELCNFYVNNAACDAQIMGRVVYALVQFPAAGSYSFQAYHDDEVKVDFSTKFSADTAANYRNFDYNVPVGSLSDFTSETGNIPSIPGSFYAQQANSCYAMRVYWNNRGGVNFLRMQWTKPDGTKEIIPAAQLKDPSLPESYASCASAATDLGVAKTAPATFTPGGALSYSIKVWNYGPVATSGVTIADTLPNTVTLNGQPTCTASGAATCGSFSNVGSAWTMITGSLPVNSTAGNPATAPTQGDYLTYTFNVTTSSTAQSITNTATITSNDLNPDNNTSTVTSQNGGKASVTKTGPAKVALGEQFSYTLTVQNGLTTALASAVVADQLPPNIKAVSVSGATCTNVPSTEGALLNCTLTAPIAAGASGSFTITAVATGIGTVTNYASTNPNGSSTPGVPGPNCNATTYSCTSAQTQVIAPAVAISKSFAPTSISTGGSSLLTITISNTSASSIDLNSLGFTDDMPANVTTTGAAMGNSCNGDLTSPGNTQLVLSGGTLAAGASCQLQWMVTSATVGSYLNNIPAGGVTSAEGATNTTPAQATLVVNAPAAIDTTKVLSTVNGQPNAGQKLRGGDVLVYTLTVKNSGGVSGTTTLTETVPGGGTYTGSGEGWSTSPACTTAASTCNQAVTVTANSSVSKTFTLTITPPVPTPTFINTVTSSNGDCNNCTISSPGVYADMAATPAKSQEVNKGDTVTVVTYCTNKGPDYAVNATCVVTGAPAGATTTCAPDPQPVNPFQVGDKFTCTTTFKAEKSGSVFLTTTAKSDTRDPVATNNKAISPVTIKEVVPPVVDDPKPVPVDSRWMLMLTALALIAAAAATTRRRNK